MIQPYFTTIILILLTLFGRSFTADLVMSQVVFRHGERGPMFDLLTDEARAYFFRGPQQLSNVGINQSRDLGSVLREMYVDTGFLDGRMMPDQYLMRSSNIERTIMTASAMVSTLFTGPTTAAIHTSDPDNDFLMSSKVMNCPGTLQRLSAKLGLPSNSTFTDCANSITSRDNANVYFNTPERQNMQEPLMIEYAAGLPVPDWMNESAYQEGERSSAEILAAFNGVGTYADSETQQLSCGLFLWTIIDNMNSYLTCQNNQNASECADLKRFYTYSSHDSMITCLAYTLNITDVLGTPPDADYTSSFAFELWKQDNSTQFVKILFRAGPGSKFKDVTSELSCYNRVSGCSLGDLTDIVQPVMTTDPLPLCYPSPAKSSMSNSTPHSSIGMLFVIMISFVLSF